MTRLFYKHNMHAACVFRLREVSVFDYANPHQLECFHLIVHTRLTVGCGQNMVINTVCIS